MFILNHHDPVPLYKQLYTQIRAHVLSGRLPAHSRLPSVREMAVELATTRSRKGLPSSPASVFDRAVLWLLCLLIA